MITTKRGSIFDSKADVLVCPVNCVGVMGKGLALEFKRRFPELLQRYHDECMSGSLYGGGAELVRPAGVPIIIAATKYHWREPSNLRYVENCIKGIRNIMTTRFWTSIAIPQLGCGCGGLEWADVWPLYEKHLGDLAATVEVWIYE